MKAREALVVFERAKETGFCVSLRGFAGCVGVVPSTIINWKNNPEKELKGIEAAKVQYVREEVEKFEPEFFNWSSFRREAAMKMLPVTATMKITKDSATVRMISKEGAARLAIEYVDELIKQLKDENK